MSWDLNRSKTLTAKGKVCRDCGKVQMTAFAFTELRTLVQKGQLTREEMLDMCEGYCLGHRNEWIPSYVIDEEK